MAAKVTFDTSVKEILVTVAPDGEGVIGLDVKTDLYSAGKVDWLNTTALRSFEYPILAIGGVVFSGGKQGSLFILRTPWKLRLYDADHELRLDGVFASEDGSRLWLFPDNGTPRTIAVLPNTPYDVVSVVPPSAADNAEKVWSHPVSAPTPGTFGALVNDTKSYILSILGRLRS